jgi:hypothetical protein
MKLMQLPYVHRDGGNPERHMATIQFIIKESCLDGLSVGQLTLLKVSKGSHAPYIYRYIYKTALYLSFPMREMCNTRLRTSIANRLK